MTQISAPPMTSNRPYLIRAIYDWIVDNHQTPHLIVDARVPGVVVPPQAIRDGIVVLNIAMSATGDLELGNDLIRFNARFSGVSRGISIPVGAVLAIRSREQGLGMVFSPESFDPEDGEDSADDGEESTLAGNGISAVPTPAVSTPAKPMPAVAAPSPLTSVPASGGVDDPPSVDPDRPRRGHLRVVK
ncbi:MAG: ClpXP protease specificity-enhancing factor [Ahniella sp.]|nr:ClpXP protease specificity-enhancing factor [Ahniella sp.]